MNLPLRKARIKLSQGNFFWHEIGQGTRILFLHSSWEDGSQWLPMIQALGTEFHCFAPDLLGFGESQGLARHYSIELEVEALAEYTEALKLRQFYLVGDSLGAWIAASYALRYPDQVNGLVLLSPEGVQVKELKRRWLKFRLLLHPFVGGLLRSLYTLKKVFKLTWVSRLLQHRDRLLNFSVACKLLFQRRWAEIEAESLQGRLEWLKSPVLVLQRQQDDAKTTLLSQTYAQLAPQAKLKRVSQTQMDWDEVIQEIRSFLQQSAS